MRDVQRLIAGDSLSFTTVVADYPADAGWVLKYRLAPRFTTPVQVPIVLTASTYETTAYQTQVSAGASASWVPGIYSWSSWVERSGERITLEVNQAITIAPDPSAVAQGTDLRSDSEIGLDNVRAMLRGKASNGVQAYTINGRELRSYSMADLLKLQASLQAEVNAERKALGLSTSGGRQRILVRCA